MSDFGAQKIGVTGATGFVGQALCQRLLEDGYELVCFGRSNTASRASFNILNLEHEFDVEKELRDVNTLIHCAARAHVMTDELANPLDAYLKYNTEATLNLARQAASAGVSRFIYLSSVKALGESTTGKGAFRYDSPLEPQDAYGVSKARAEEGLRRLAEASNMEVTIIRPPLVYGSGVKANFAAMLDLARKNLPLPLASIRNRRSLVALDNLVDLISTCIAHEEAGNQTFMVSDDRNFSTPGLFTAMTRAYGKSPRLVAFPPKLLLLAASVLGKRAVAERVLGSLHVDIEHTKKVLNWKPQVRFEDVLRKILKR